MYKKMIKFLLKCSLRKLYHYKLISFSLIIKTNKKLAQFFYEEKENNILFQVK